VPENLLQRLDAKMLDIQRRVARRVRPGGGRTQGLSYTESRHLDQDGQVRVLSPRERKAMREQGLLQDNYGSANPVIAGPGTVLNVPTGPLDGVDQHGNIPYYDPDNAKVINRLFNLHLAGDPDEQ
jgi:hypothetical protein